MNGYVVFWNNEKTEVYAETQLQARDRGVVFFQARTRKKVKPYDVTAVLAEKNGKRIVTDPASF